MFPLTIPYHNILWWESILVTVNWSVNGFLGGLTIFNEGAYSTFKSIFHKALNSFWFNCEITLKSVPGTNQY